MLIQIIGEVSAGKPFEFFPITRWRDIRPSKKVPAHIEHAAAYARGESLVDAGIIDGDIAIFRKTHEAREGELVVALTPFGLTIKYLFYEDGRIVLRPANPLYEDQIYDVQDVEIRGVVKRIERDL